MPDRKRSKHECGKDVVAEAGGARYEELRPELEKLPPGSYVAIGSKTGVYATGASMSEAADAFDRLQGKPPDREPAYIRRIGQLSRV